MYENYKIIITDQAEKEIKELKRDIPEEYKKVEVFLCELQENPFLRDGKLESLKYLEGCFSKRVSHKDRLIYEVDGLNKTVTVIGVRGHYDDH